MAGYYKRFESLSLNIPKYLLPYKDQSIFYEVVKGHLSSEITKISFIVNKRDSNYFNLLKFQIKSLKIQNFNFVVIEKTNSQIETINKGILKILEKSKNNLPLAITNIDTLIINRNFKLYNNLIKKNDCLVDIFKSNNRGYSYVIFDKNKNVINIKEKIIISNYASSGLYIFKNSKILLEQLKISMNDKDGYFSQMINRMIQSNLKVICNKISNSEKTIVLGTPDQYLSEIQK
jgi:NDP-sugar pyrophosphorylase family protein